MISSARPEHKLALRYILLLIREQISSLDFNLFDSIGAREPIGFSGFHLDQMSWITTNEFRSNGYTTKRADRSANRAVLCLAY